VASPTIPGYARLIQIGKGGFSRVYRGEQVKLKRGVAIKVLNFGLSDEADRRSFERECELLGRVSTHPNIVTVHDTAFTEDGQPCIVMEHYPGGSLADLIGEVGRLRTQEALEVGVAIAAALEASHQAGVLHCDLKPQNILISEFGQPALGDFGISTFSEERTRTGSDVAAGFTLAYAAPEIVEGDSPAVGSDVYSLAATLYTSLAGRRPFAYPAGNGDKPLAAEQARRILLEEPAALTEFGVAPELDRVIRAAMAKDPASRPRTAADFARSLYQVGHQLGLSTSSPRIASQGALSVRDPQADFAAGGGLVAPVASPGPFASLPVSNEAPASQAALVVDDRTEVQAPSAPVAQQVQDDATTPRVDTHASPVPEVEPPGASPSKRRMLAPMVGLISLLLVGGVLLAVTSGGTDDNPEVALPTPTPRAPQAEALLAPPVPQNVVAQRAGASSVVLSWSTGPDDDVQYEVRRDDAASNPGFSDNPLLLSNIDPDDTTCFQVIAVRGNRLSPAVDDACVSALGSTYVDATPMVCNGTCEISLTLSGFDAEQLIEVTALDATDRSAVEVEYDDELRTDDTGAAPNWRVTFGDDTPPGTYLLELTTADSGDTHRAAVVVEPVGE